MEIHQFISAGKMEVHLKVYKPRSVCSAHHALHETFM